MRSLVFLPGIHGFFALIESSSPVSCYEGIKLELACIYVNGVIVGKEKGMVCTWWTIAHAVLQQKR
jgi:hypothetical protein